MRSRSPDAAARDHAQAASDLRTAGQEACLSGGRTDIMAHTADGAQPSPGQERSTGELVKALSEQVSALVREELKLAQLEMTRKGKQAGVGVGMLGGSGLIALYGAGCLLACVIIALSGVVAAWLAALIVGAGLLAVAPAAG